MAFDDASVPPTRKPETSEYLVGRPIDWSHWTRPRQSARQYASARAPLSTAHGRIAPPHFFGSNKGSALSRGVAVQPNRFLVVSGNGKSFSLARSLSVPSLALSACCDLRTKSQSFASLELAAAVGGVISALSFARSDILSPSLHNSKRNFIASYQVATFANLLGRRRRPTWD